MVVAERMKKRLKPQKWNKGRSRTRVKTSGETNSPSLASSVYIGQAQGGVKHVKSEPN